MSDYFEVRLSLLIKEWEITNEKMSSYDGTLLTIRGWAITVTSAIIAYAFVEKNQVVALLSIVPTLLIGGIDVIFKGYQRRMSIRREELEQFFKSSDFKDAMQNSDIGTFDTPALSRKTHLRWSGHSISVVSILSALSIWFTYGSLVTLAFGAYLLIRTGLV